MEAGAAEAPHGATASHGITDAADVPSPAADNIPVATKQSLSGKLVVAARNAALKDAINNRSLIMSSSDLSVNWTATWQSQTELGLACLAELKDEFGLASDATPTAVLSSWSTDNNSNLANRVCKRWRDSYKYILEQLAKV
jgi:hypothetical protein